MLFPSVFSPRRTCAHGRAARLPRPLSQGSACFCHSSSITAAAHACCSLCVICDGAHQPTLPCCSPTSSEGSLLTPTPSKRTCQTGRALPVPNKALVTAGGLSTGHPSPHCHPHGVSPFENLLFLKCCSSICSPGTGKTCVHTHIQAAAASQGTQTIPGVRLVTGGVCSLCFEHVVCVELKYLGNAARKQHNWTGTITHVPLLLLPPRHTPSPHHSFHC